MLSRSVARAGAVYITYLLTMPRSGSDKAAGGGLWRDPIALKVKVIEAKENHERRYAFRFSLVSSPPPS